MSTTLNGPQPPEIWTEKVVVAQLQAGLADIADATVWSGQSSTNRFAPNGWDLVGMRRFQYGDFRLQTPRIVAVVEIDTAGGVTNLAKYWPYLASRPPELEGCRFVFAHIFALSSVADYTSHLQLWDFLQERMAEALTQAEINWTARRFGGRSVAVAVGEVVDYIRNADRGPRPD